jgi:hypothetical protein
MQYIILGTGGSMAENDSNGFVKVTNKEIYNQLKDLQGKVDTFITAIIEQHKSENRAGSCPKKDEIEDLKVKASSIKARFILNLSAVLIILISQVVMWFFATR